MFRPNRIGTPNIYKTAIVDDTTSFTPNSNNATLPAVTGHVINAAPVADFDMSNLTWDGPGRTITAAHKLAFGQQFTITQPLVGDTVGLELIGAININANKSILIQPFLAKLPGAAPSGVLANFSTGTGIGTLRIGTPTRVLLDANQVWSGGHYQTTALQSDSTAVSGVYVHGFIIYVDAGASTTLSGFHMQAGIRQLNDQQNVAYRDTLR